MKRLALILACALSFSCVPAPAPHPQVDVCAGFCEAAQELSCPEGSPSPGGVPCLQWCENYHAQGYLKPFAECGAAAENVNQMRACGVECER